MISVKYFQPFCVEYQSISLKNHPMKKSLLLAAMLLIFWQISNAQLRIAIAGGAHSSTVVKTNFFLGGGPYLSFFYNGFEKKEIYLKTGKFETEETTDLPVGDGVGQYK